MRDTPKIFLETMISKEVVAKEVVAKEVVTIKNISEEADNTECWIFGYGSLIWKPPPVYEEKLVIYFILFSRGSLHTKE